MYRGNGALRSVLFTKYYSGDLISENEMGCACNTYGVRIGADRFLAGRPEGKRKRGIPKPRWGDNIKIDIQEGDGGMDRIDVAQDRDSRRAVMSAVVDLLVP